MIATISCFPVSVSSYELLVLFNLLNILFRQIVLGDPFLYLHLFPLYGCLVVLLNLIPRLLAETIPVFLESGNGS